MDSEYIAWIISMIAFAMIVMVLGDLQWCRKRHKLRISRHRDLPFLSCEHSYRRRSTDNVSRALV
jgi:hypothetical protein